MVLASVRLQNYARRNTPLTIEHVLLARIGRYMRLGHTEHFAGLYSLDFTQPSTASSPPPELE